MIRFILSTLLLLCIYFIFLIVPLFIGGFSTCRENAWWNERDRVQRYYEIKSPRIARLLIGEYSGFSTSIRTNVPLLFNRYLVNRYPSRISAMGVINYVVTAALAIWHSIAITAYFFFAWPHFVPSDWILLMVHSLIFGILCDWNKSRVKFDRYEMISKGEMKRRKKENR